MAATTPAARASEAVTRSTPELGTSEAGELVELGLGAREEGTMKRSVAARHTAANRVNVPVV